MSDAYRVLPVIMSGGSGTRLWPLSTEDRPKQFHALASELSMIQDTALRFGPHERLEFLNPLVVCNHRHGELAAEQLTAMNVPAAAVILEPFGRNTAGVAAISAAWAQAHAPGAFVLLLPADHVVLDVEGFRTAVETACRAAEDQIVTFGIEPTGPETGYGYIQGGEALYPGAFKVLRFVEKPSRAVAEAYLAEGGYSWNAGIFLFHPDVFLAEAERLCPEVAARSLEALRSARRDGVFVFLDAHSFATCPSEPIDTAVMEKTSKAAVVPCSVGWADVGSWSELWRQGPQDARGNFSRGDVLTLDTSGSLVWSDGPTVATIGVSDLIVIATKDHVLVLPKDRAQDVKKIVDAMREKKAAPQ